MSEQPSAPPSVPPLDPPLDPREDPVEPPVDGPVVPEPPVLVDSPAARAGDEGTDPGVLPPSRDG
ncbi:hypothetical protein ACFYYH_06525 [Streptomyces sp. NPDC002018]|uniref:hypothetical protein n=1 Tax=Streptomyces sp. NPDC002018 TaxID=3364629 RepID=UPI00369BDA7A